MNGTVKSVPVDVGLVVMDRHESPANRLRRAIAACLTAAVALAPASFLVPSCGAPSPPSSPSSGQSRPPAPSATPVR